MPGKSRKISRTSRIGKHKKTMKKRVKKSRRNRHKKYYKGMMGGVTPPTTPPRRFNIVQIPPPQTPPGQQFLPKEPTVSPKNKGPTEVNDSEGIQPLALFQE